MKNSFVTGLILVTMAICSIVAQYEKRFQFSNWKSENGKEYEDNSHEKLR